MVPHYYCYCSLIHTYSGLNFMELQEILTSLEFSAGFRSEKQIFKITTRNYNSKSSFF